MGILCLLSAGGVQAAQTPLGSLAARWQTPNADTNRVNTLTALAEGYRNTAPNKAVDYAFRALRLAEKLGFGAGRARALDHLGWSYYRPGELDKALSFSLQALSSIITKANSGWKASRAKVRRSTSPCPYPP